MLLSAATRPEIGFDIVTKGARRYKETPIRTGAKRIGSVHI